MGRTIRRIPSVSLEHTIEALRGVAGVRVSKGEASCREDVGEEIAPGNARKVSRELKEIGFARHESVSSELPLSVRSEVRSREFDRRLEQVAEGEFGRRR